MIKNLSKKVKVVSSKDQNLEYEKREQMSPWRAMLFPGLGKSKSGKNVAHQSRRIPLSGSMASHKFTLIGKEK